MSPDRVTIGTQMKQDLDALLHAHAAPWRIDLNNSTGARILNAHDDEVLGFDDEDLLFHSGIVAAINFYNAVTAPTPIRISDPVNAPMGDEDAGGGP